MIDAGSTERASVPRLTRIVLGRRDGRWLNEPSSWTIDAAGDLTIVSDQDTDFRRETHCGFMRDCGHFFGFTAPSAFTAQVRVRGDYQALYDQAGGMIRIDERRWVKAGSNCPMAAMRSSVLTDG